MKIPTSSLQQAKEMQQQSPEQKLQDVASMYEKHFLREMLKAMRGTVQESGFIKKNQAEEIFREQLDGEYIDKWGAQGGVGFQKIIYDQLVEKYGAQLGIKKPDIKSIGPLPIQTKDFTATVAAPPKAYDLGFKFQKDETHKGPQELIVPWSGVLMKKMALDENMQMLEFEHDNGMKSQMVFKGLSKIQTGTKVEEGQTLGLLSPEAKSFYWNLKQNSDSVSE